MRVPVSTPQNRSFLVAIQMASSMASSISFCYRFPKRISGLAPLINCTRNVESDAGNRLGILDKVEFSLTLLIDFAFGVN